MKMSEVALMLAIGLLTGGWKNHSSTIEIHRAENNGRMNVIPCVIELQKFTGTNNEDVKLLDYSVLGLDGKKEKRLDDKGRIFIIGGDHAFLKVEKGKYRISVYTPTEYQEKYVPNNTDTWKSNSLDMNIVDNKKFVLSVEPTVNDGEYNGGWTIRLEGK